MTDERLTRLQILEHRFAALHEASLAITAELSLTAVLQRIVDLARELAEARYAALGITTPDGVITEFWTSGITAEQRAAIGAFPHGHGLLGVLIRDRQVLRVPDMGRDPRAAGFPPNHPPMRSLLGVPLIFQERVVGDLYLTDKRTAADFDGDDERLVTMLAAQAAVAIANAHLYQTMQEQFQQAEAQRRHLQTIIDSMPNGVVITDRQGHRVMINAAGIGLFGPLAADDGGERIPYAGVAAFRRADGQALRRGELPLDRASHEQRMIEDELIVERPSGERRTVQVHVAPLLDAAGRSDGAVGVFRDITNYREAEQLKDDFLSLVSHELRTPLTTIHGGAWTLLRHLDDLEVATMRGLLTDIVSETERLRRLVSNMLDLSRIRAGRLQLTTEPFVLGPLIRRLCEAIAASLAGRTVSVQLAPDLPPVEGDPERIEQVIRNLLENAGKYVPLGGQIVISARVEDELVVTTIRDNGPGIAADELPQIFERFHRAAGSGQQAGGAGLGLYLSRHLIEAHGGRLWAESQLGQGSAFSFSLPIAR